jgi:hypothetical protein
MRALLVRVPPLGSLRAGIGNPLATRDSGRDHRSDDEPGPIRKRAAAPTCTNRSSQVHLGRVRMCAYYLKTVARKGLWVRVPRPPQPVTCGFALRSSPLSGRIVR